MGRAGEIDGIRVIYGIAIPVCTEDWAELENDMNLSETVRTLAKVFDYRNIPHDQIDRSSRISLSDRGECDVFVFGVTVYETSCSNSGYIIDLDMINLILENKDRVVKEYNDKIREIFSEKERKNYIGTAKFYTIQGDCICCS